MLGYALFREIISDRIKAYLPEEYKDCDIKIKPIQTVNGLWDGLTILPRNAETGCYNPTIYINHMYESYQKNQNLGDVIQKAAYQAVKNLESAKRYGSISYGDAKENILMMVVNTQANCLLLQDLPHREELDLSVIYYWMLQVGEEGITSTKVTYDIADRLHLSEPELHELALENMKRLLPPSIKTLEEVAMGEEREGPPSDDGGYVVSNEDGINGAVYLLDDEVRHMLAKQYDSDLYIIPSSIHESATRFAA